jgi:hypothetical protein
MNSTTELYVPPVLKIFEVEKFGSNGNSSDFFRECPVLNSAA